MEPNDKEKERSKGPQLINKPFQDAQESGK